MDETDMINEEGSIASHTATTDHSATTKNLLTTSVAEDDQNNSGLNFIVTTDNLAGNSVIVKTSFRCVSYKLY